LAGSVASNAVGAALIEAEDSLCFPTRLSTCANTYSNVLNSCGITNLAVLALPDEVGLSSATADLVCLLYFRVSTDGTRDSMSGRQQLDMGVTYEAADADPIGMGLPARSALDPEGVPERVGFGVAGTEVGDPDD
jgi:hypothetical protein